MKLALLVLSVVGMWACALPIAPSPAPARGAPEASTPPVDSVQAERDLFMAAVLRQIEGRESEPAGEVFENIEVMSDVPAGRLVRIMNMGYGRSLGVSCTHCHVANDWAAEDSTAKAVARDMMRMTRAINAELLASIEGLRSERPTVNCTTCHRGAVVPALDLTAAR